MRLTMVRVQELRVMGMASLSSRDRICLEVSGVSLEVIRSRLLVRMWLKARKATDKMEPMDTPSRAPEADRRLFRSSSGMAELRMRKASARPRNILDRASMTWEMPVGTMFMWPWA